MDNKPTSAKIKSINGAPRLTINGTPVAPIIFFGNTDRGMYVTEQVSLAGSNGIYLHSCIYNLHFTCGRPETCENNTGSTSDEITDLRRCLDAVISGDPECQIFLRVKAGAYFGKAPDEWKDGLIVFRDGSVYPEGSETCFVSTASDMASANRVQICHLPPTENLWNGRDKNTVTNMTGCRFSRSAE